ncbi:MAG: NUDIX domain-containing protein [Planctomycetota bacterium]|jgi:8-oxo-dGTP diphosphatase|nr:NUDIX domain-containing protein [Blastopirellula sp.]
MTRIPNFSSMPEPSNPSTEQAAAAGSPGAAGVVAVIRRDEQFLMIQRGLKLARAPGMFCFPGGTIEKGETPLQALHREMQEELGIRIEPRSRIWNCRTTRGVELEWWATEVLPGAAIRPCPHEIAWFGWMELEQILLLDQLLPTNQEFLRQLQAGQIRWP